MPSPTSLAGLDRALRRFFGALVAILVGLGAMNDARGFVRAVADKLGIEAPRLAAAPRTPSAPEPASGEPLAISPDAIQPHDLLDRAAPQRDPRAGMEPPAAVEPWGAPVATLEDLARAPDCDDVRVLIVAEADDPAWSVAALAPVEGDGPVVLRRRGGSLGRRSLAFVGRDRVVLAEGGRLCQARIFEGPRGSGAARTRAAAEVRKEAGPGLPADVRSRIRRTGPGSFDVDRTLVEQVLASPAELMRHGRITADAQDGRLGLRLLDVRGDSLLGAIGLESDDRLEAINGFELTSAEKMMEAYARLRTADRLSVTVQRGAGRVTLDYAIR
jgi:general secretion pathway protein C